MSGPLDLPTMQIPSMEFGNATPSMKLTDEPTLAVLKDVVTKGIGKKSYPDLMANVGAMQAIQKDASEGKDARTQFYESLKGDQNTLNKKRQELLKQMSENQQMDKSQIAAMMLIGILPTLVGGLVKGRKGAAIGAQAGGLGAQSLAQGMQQDTQVDRAVAKSGIDAVDSQLKENADSLNKIKLDEFNNADKSAEGALDRATSTHNASIRAGGEMGAAKITAAELRATRTAQQIKEADTEAKARGTAIVFNNHVYEPGPGYRNKDVDAVRETQAANQAVADNLKRMRALSASLDYGAFERSIGDKSTELGILYEDTIDALAIAKEASNSSTTKIEFGRLERKLKDPSSVWNNFVSATNPLSTTVDDNLKITEKILNRNFDRFLKAKGMQEPKQLGSTIVENGRTYYLIGVGPRGGPLYSPDKSKLSSIMGLK